MRRVRFEDMCAAAGARVYAGVPAEVTGVRAASSEVCPGDVFVALKGRRADGHDHVPEALSRGAAALITGRRVRAAGVCCALAEDSKKAAGLAADFFHGHPSRAFALVGVTGTNGKTTLCHLLRHIWESGGTVSGIVGTVLVKCGSFSGEATLTTPAATALQDIFSRMRSEGARRVCMEVSSHAIAERRVSGCDFDAAVFTNLTPEHLDYHGTMSRYAETKKKLFTEILPASAKKDRFSVINIDDPAGAEIAAAAPGEVVTCSAGGAAADVSVSRARHSPDGVAATLQTPWGALDVDSNLIGGHNLSNMAAAAAVALRLGSPPAAVASALSSPVFVPGRMERVGGPGCSISVFVDYAHTADALERALAAVRPLCSGRVFVVFGCGGDRDRAKRPEMGRVAREGADVAVITSDNPRGEDPAAIIGEIKKGMGGAARAAVGMEDRREAIGRAVMAAAAGDLVLIAGKGHETSQIVGGRRLPFDDREAAAEFLRMRGEPV